MSAARIRVALVDDQALFRAGIRMLVASQPDLQFVGEAGDGAQGVALAAETQPDVVLMDIRMPIMDGIESTRRILESAESAGRTIPRIIVLTTFDLDEAAARAIRGERVVSFSRTRSRSSCSRRSARCIREPR